MATIYITGHINPDLDCTAAAVTYAHLKNAVDSENSYIPIRCGALNDQTREAFKKAALPEPALYKSLGATVGDIALSDFPSLHADDPVHAALEIVHSKNISLVPVFDSEEQFIGSISINEISAYLAAQFDNHRPVHNFSVANFERVIPGKYVCKGERSTFQAPIVAGAMPYNNYEDWFAHFNEKPLLIVGNRPRIISHAIEHQFPAIIVTGVQDPSELNIDTTNYTGSMYLSLIDSAECIRLLRISVPVSYIVNSSIPHMQVSETFDSAKVKLLNSDFRGFPVFDNDNFFGIVTRRCFIEKPAKNLILVDHNEVQQSVPGATDACILEILDHHRFAAERTNKPIYIASRPVGSTSTIVFQHYASYRVDIPKEIAIILQAGIISDTVNLKSPTTTEDDRRALAEIARISGIANNDFAEEMFSQLQALKTRDPREVIAADFKTYSQYGLNIGIGQVEVTNLSEVQELSASFSQGLDRISQEKSLDWSLLLITNVLKQNSILLSSNFAAGTSQLIYNALSPVSFDLPQIISRKKQVLPEILRIAEELEAQH